MTHFTSTGQEIRPGDILKRNNQFYRVADFARRTRDAVVNRVLYNPKLNNLVIAHEYIYIPLDDIGQGKPYEYIDMDSPEVMGLLEMVKRKWKLLKLEEKSGDLDDDTE